MSSRKVLALGLFILTLLASSASAEQFITYFHGREVVVHTNRIPVVMHRLVPPQYGRHITIRELHADKDFAPSQVRYFPAR